MFSFDIALHVETAHHPDFRAFGFHQCDRTSVRGRELKPRLRGEPDKLLPVTEQLSLIGSDGEGRDVVQRWPFSSKGNA